MRTSTRLAFAGAFLLAAVAAPTGASAHPGFTCAWVAANAHLSKRIYYSFIAVMTNVSGSFVSNVGPPCSFEFTLATAACDRSDGTGTVYDGTSAHSFTWTHAGNHVVFTGGFNGDSTFDPNVFLGDSCVTGADDFLMTGQGVTA